MRQFVVLITVAEVPSIGVQVKNAVILLDDSFLSLSRSLSGNDVKLFPACRHHTHELYACAHSCFAACGSSLKKIRRHTPNAVDEVHILLRQGKLTRQAPHRLSERKRLKAFQRS